MCHPTTAAGRLYRGEALTELPTPNSDIGKQVSCATRGNPPAEGPPIPLALDAPYKHSEPIGCLGKPSTEKTGDILINVRYPLVIHNVSHLMSHPKANMPWVSVKKPVAFETALSLRYHLVFT